jgi:mannitol operon repressor
MRLDHAEDLAKFVEELKRETDRGLPLVGTALIDEKLRDTLEAFLIEKKIAKKLLDEPNSTLGSFSSRLDMCYALGLIDNYEYNEINLLRKVRNEFAHSKHGISFKTDKIIGLCSTLRSILPEEDGFPLKDPKFRYMNSVVCIIFRLYCRPENIRKEQRITKSYGNNDGKFIPIKD